MTTNIIVSPEESPEAIQDKLDALQPGDQVLFRPGTYRMSLRVAARGTPDAPITVEAETPGDTTICGADVVTEWRQDGEDWVSDIDLSGLAPSLKHGWEGGRREQVFIDGQPQRQVRHYDQLAGGCFWYDEERKRLHLRPGVFPGEQRDGVTKIEKGSIQGGGEAEIDRADPLHRWPFLVAPFVPENHCIEVTRRCRLLELAGDYREPEEGSRHIHLKGFRFRASGDAPQQAMVHIGGANHRIENCRFEWGAARGFDLRCHRTAVRNCVARMNGQMGFSGYGEDNLVEDTLLQHNNFKHRTFTCFEQGGCKIVRTKRFVMRRVRAIGNDGPGIWYDIDNEDAMVERCWCEGNTGPGIMYEISYAAVIRNNVCWRNGFQPRKDAFWDSHGNSMGREEMVYGQGILIQMSRDVRCYNNTCVGNQRVGIDLRHHPYQQAGNYRHSEERYKLERNEVFNNLLADNGWCNLDETMAPLNPVKKDEVADNNYDHNLYHNSTSLLEHGGDLTGYARWGKTLGYGVQSLEEWRAARDKDMHSLQWDPAFLSPDQGDFRLEEWSPAKGRGLPVEELTEDFDGRPRPPDQPPTIGAFA